MSSLSIPEAPELLGSITSIISIIYSPDAYVGRHVQEFFKGKNILLPPLPNYDNQVNGLLAALKANPTIFTSNLEFCAFLANVLWESIGLSVLTESCVITNSCVEPIYYGRGYIQLTGRSNYEAFAAFMNMPDILTNPDQIFKNETLAWASALHFWNTANGCKGSTDAGRALICVNSPECISFQTQSSVYFQFAPFYRLEMNRMLANDFGLPDTDVVAAAKQACSQMNVPEIDAWSQFCLFHGNSSSINCSSPPSPVLITLTATSPTSTSTSPTSTSTSTETLSSSALGKVIGNSIFTSIFLILFSAY